MENIEMKAVRMLANTNDFENIESLPIIANIVIANTVQSGWWWLYGLLKHFYAASMLSLINYIHEEGIGDVVFDFKLISSHNFLPPRWRKITAIPYRYKFIKAFIPPDLLENTKNDLKNIKELLKNGLNVGGYADRLLAIQISNGDSDLLAHEERYIDGSRIEVIAPRNILEGRSWIYQCLAKTMYEEVKSFHVKKVGEREEVSKLLEEIKDEGDIKRFESKHIMKVSNDSRELNDFIPIIDCHQTALSSERILIQLAIKLNSNEFCPRCGKKFKERIDNKIVHEDGECRAEFPVHHVVGWLLNLYGTYISCCIERIEGHDVRKLKSIDPRLVERSRKHIIYMLKGLEFNNELEMRHGVLYLNIKKDFKKKIEDFEKEIKGILNGKPQYEIEYSYSGCEGEMLGFCVAKLIKLLIPNSKLTPHESYLENELCRVKIKRNGEGKLEISIPRKEGGKPCIPGHYRSTIDPHHPLITIDNFEVLRDALTTLIKGDKSPW